MRYVYILKSINFPNKVYVGSTSNIKKRFAAHNAGSSAHTSKYKPWEVIVCIFFKDATKANAFEKYLKSGSGRSFRKKRLI